ncbi:MAG TPA: hypothetical protein VG965_01640 [Patescibacteria group bacterium]|nr:hypothetical protein [Patescibacteria group bacterium]
MSLETRQALHDHEFQDFLAETGLMKRRPVEPGDLDLKPHAKYPNIPLSPTAVKFLDRLEKDEGYVVPREDVAEILYGVADRATLSATSTWSSEVRERMEHPENFLVVPYTGFAVGVENFKLAPAKLDLVYHLWQNMWNEVSSSSMARSRYGEVTDSTKRTVVGHMYDLRTNVLPETGARIDLIPSKGGGDAHFTLHYLDDESHESPLVPEEAIPEHLSFQFQDWLAQDEVRLLRRVKKGRPSKIHKSEGVQLSDLESKFLDCFNNNTGYVLPYEFLSAALYSELGNKARILALTKRFRSKINQPELIRSIERVGYGTGIEGLDLYSDEMRVLNILWQNLERPVLTDELADQIFGEASPRATSRIQTSAWSLRAKLIPTSFHVVSNKVLDNPRCVYQLLPGNAA